MLKKNIVLSELNAKVDHSLDEKYKEVILFKEKYEWAKRHVKGRNINKEIEDALATDNQSNKKRVFEEK